MLAPMAQILDGSIFGPGQPCFACSPDHPIGFRLAFEIEEDRVVTRFTPGEQYQGPPGIMHGGLVMTLADEVAAWSCVALLGKFGFTARVEGRLSKAARVGVEIVGRLAGIRDGQAQFSGALKNLCAMADLKMNRLLDGIDAWVSENGMASEFEAPERFAPTRVSDAPRLGMNLADSGIKTIIWATGTWSQE